VNRHHRPAPPALRGGPLRRTELLSRTRRLPDVRARRPGPAPPLADERPGGSSAAMPV